MVERPGTRLRRGCPLGQRPHGCLCSSAGGGALYFYFRRGLLREGVRQQMTVRFRIRTPRGQELSFASHEMFAEFVRSGDLSPEDLVYDGDTGEWAPARTHPVVLEIEYEREEQAAETGVAEEGKSGASGPLTAADLGLDLAESQPSPEDEEEADTRSPVEGDPEAVFAPEPGSSDSTGGEDFGLELAPPAEGLSAEEEAHAFVERMESERATDTDFGVDTEGIEGFKMDDSRVFSDVLGAPPPPTRPDGSLIRPRSTGTHRRRQRAHPSRRAGPRRSAEPSEGSPSSLCSSV